MSKKEVEKALRLATETNVLEIGEDILNKVPIVFKEQFPGKKGIVIADPNTYRVAGEKVQRLLLEAGLVDSDPLIISDPDLYATYRFVEKIVTFLKERDLITVAVGSGVINDLSKRANYELERPYMCVATAASMDGYTSYGASITKSGSKITMTCPAPLAVVADLTVISQAPPILTASGYADLYAKITSGADWILADAMGVEKIDSTSWHIVQDGLAASLIDPAGAKEGKRSAILPLTEGLMLGGFAMQSFQSSRPASGAEHQLSHLWDMEHHTFNGEMAKQYGLYKNQDEQAPSHGFKVGIGTLAITALYERILATPLDQLDVDQAVDAWKSLEEQIAEAQEMFKGTGIEEYTAKQLTAKYCLKTELKSQLTTLKTNWPTIKAALQKQIIPYSETKKRLKLVGAPVECEEIGITRERLKASFYRAQKIRDRFTVLDVAVRTNYLDRWVDELFGPEGVLRSK